MSTPRIAAAWVALLSVATVAFTGLNASAALTHGRAGTGDVLVSVLLLVLAGVGFRAARQLWRCHPAGHREAMVFLGIASLGALWLALQVPFGWLGLAISVAIMVALVRDRIPPAA